MSAPTTKATSTCPTCGKPRLLGATFCGYCGGTFQAPARRVTRRFTPNLRGSAIDLYYVIAAAVLAVMLSHLPVIDSAIYPFKLFGTFVHEWCHALVAIATGGQVERLQINGDLSGETLTAGGWLLPIFSAGYTGAAIVGALLLIVPTRFANRVLVGIGAVSILMPLIGGLSFGTSFTANTWIWTSIFGAATLAVGLFATPRLGSIFQQFVAVELCFTAIDALRDLSWLSLNSPNTQTDAYNASHFIGMPEIVWSVMWGLIALAAIILAVTRVVRRSFA